MVGGYMGKYLDVDMSSGAIGELNVPGEEAITYLGGKGVAARLLYDLLPEGTDPLSPHNIVIINTGPLTATGAPGSSRANLTTKSPLTGLIASSSCGGDFGLYLKRAGYDGLILKGRSERPVWLEIDEKGARLSDASHLWGKGAIEVQEMAPGGKGKIAIGPAGENLVKFALVMSGERAFARCGVGTVLGSKHLKGASAAGSKKPPIAKREDFKSMIKEWAETLTSHPLSGMMMREYGTAMLVNRCNAASMLPTRNFRYGQFSEAEDISGEEMAEKHLVGRTGCYACPVRCGRLVLDPRNPQQKIKGPEYETLGMLGSNLCISSLESIFEWNHVCDELGMDTISAGATLGTAMELSTLGALDVDISFGNPEGVTRALQDIAHRRGIGDLMAEGARRLAEECGNPHLAPHSKGLELPAYNPRFAFGHGLGYAVANRGACHINGGYLAGIEGAGTMLLDPFETRGKAALAVIMQDLIEGFSASGGCIFSFFIVTPSKLAEKILFSNTSPLVIKAITKFTRVLRIFDYLPYKILAFNLPLSILPIPLVLEAVTGRRFTFGRFLEAGARIFDMERSFNLREGLNPAADDVLSGRLMGDSEDDVAGRGVPLEEMLHDYYRARGWDKYGRLKHGV